MPTESILKTIADNGALTKAVRELIESYFSLDAVNTGMTNDQIGQVIRARVQGLEKIDAAFKEIETYRTIEAQPEQSNPAR